MDDVSTSFMYQEIVSQPELWRRILGMDDQLNKFFHETGGPLALVGCGTSFYIAGAISKLREDLGFGVSDPFQASEIYSERRYPWVLAISRSGTTTEVLDALRGLKSKTRCMLITANANSSMLDNCERSLIIDFADESSIVQTRFATCALMVARRYFGQEMEDVIKQCDIVFSKKHEDLLVGVEKIVFLGRGWAAYIAGEAALKMTECAGFPCNYYPSMEFRHGPMSAIDDSTLVWAIGPQDDELIADIEGTGAKYEGGTLDPIVELVRVQLQAESQARRVGRDPDRPPFLNRSVILERS